MRLMTDNSTTLACMNKVGSTKPACNSVALEIWLWCLEHENFITSVHLPRVENVEAGSESRTDRRELRRKLNSDMLSLGPM